VYGIESKAALFFGISIVAALLNNFFAFAVYSSQQIQAVAQAGYLPEHLAYRSPVHQGPIASSIFVSIIGIAVTASFSLTFGRAEAQNVLVMASLVPAVLGYIIVLDCIVRIRKLEGTLERGERDPSVLTMYTLGADPGKLRWGLGVIGARVGQAICILFYVGLLTLASTKSPLMPNADFLWGHVALVVLGVMNYTFMFIFRRLSRNHHVPSSVSKQTYEEVESVDMQSNEADASTKKIEIKFKYAGQNSVEELERDSTEPDTETASSVVQQQCSVQDC